MTFLLHSVDSDRIPPTEYIAAEAGTYAVGECVAVDTAGSHQLDTSTKPTHICVEAVTISNAGDPLACVRIADDQIWETTKDGTATIYVGSTYDVSSDGKQLDDNATTNNNLQVVYVEGAALGDTVRVRFV